MIFNQTNNGKTTITVNGHKIEVGSGTLSIQNDRILVNGVEIMTEATGIVRLEIVGDPISVTSHAAVTVSGNVSGNLDAGGSVTVSGNVYGNVDAGGSVRCGTIGGNLDAGGSVRCQGK